jgi:hypothetical protein
MWTAVKRSAFLVAVFLAASGGLARAATVEVTVPFPFLVHGQMLPAGDYRIDRDEMDPSILLIRGEHGNRANMFLLTTPAAGHDPVERPALVFTRHEAQYRLIDVWESGDEGFVVLK